MRASPDASRPAAAIPRSSASIRTRQAVCDSRYVHTGAPTRPATRSSRSAVVTRRMSASIRAPSSASHAPTAWSAGGQRGWRRRRSRRRACRRRGASLPSAGAGPRGSPACWWSSRASGLSVAGSAIASSAEAGVSPTISALYALFERTRSASRRAARAAREGRPPSAARRRPRRRRRAPVERAGARDAARLAEVERRAPRLRGPRPLRGTAAAAAVGRDRDDRS